MTMTTITTNHDKGCCFVGFETLPWACRFTDWGKRATILGTKGSILAAVTPEKDTDRALSMLQGLLGVFPMISRSPNNLGISLRNPGHCCYCHCHCHCRGHCCYCFCYCHCHCYHWCFYCYHCCCSCYCRRWYC